MQHVQQCTRCYPSHVAPLYTCELVHMDYLSLEPSKVVLVITDHFTRYALAYPSIKQLKLQFCGIICHYGFPEKFISDQGRNFEFNQGIV